jgi:hypothetical protein
MKKTGTNDILKPSQHLDSYINDLSDWRGTKNARLRTLIREAALSSRKNGNGIPPFGPTKAMWLRLVFSRIM